MAGMSASRSSSTDTGSGLRERKKLRTRLAIQRHALQLFTDQGYDSTTVEQIAAAAEVSPSTFFRYYPTKEDVVLTDEYDPMFFDAIRARPAEEPPLTAMHTAMMGLMPQVLADGGRETIQRLRLVLAIPALRGRVLQSTAETTTILAEALADRGSRHRPDFQDRAAAAAYIGMAVVVLFEWIEHGGDPAALLEAGMQGLRAGLG